MPRFVVVAIAALGACTQTTTRGWECLAPANPGGGWDLTCRSAARVLAELGASPGTMRVSNMPGAGGGVAFAHAVAQREGDAGVIVAASPATTLRLAQGQYGDLTEHDVRWVAAIGAEYGIIAVQRDAPWRTLDDLIAAWRRDPGSLVVGGGSAVAGQDHMKVLLLAHQAGIDPRRIRYVPFDGGGEAMTSLLGGFIQVFSGEGSEVEAHVEAGTLRVVAVLAPARLDGPMAAVPTAKEQGYDVEWITWRGFYVPGGLGPEQYDRWAAVLGELGASRAWAAARERNRLEPYLRVGPEFEQFVHRQVAQFREMSREIGLLR